MTQQNLAIKNRGEAAEAIACSWLESQSYSRLQANYFRRLGEIDLIMRAPDEQTIVFVEVRFRSSSRFGGAVVSVDNRKQRKLIRTASAWLQQNADALTQARIDVIGISPPEQSDSAHSTTENIGYSPNKVQMWQGYLLTWVVNAVEC